MSDQRFMIACPECGEHFIEIKEGIRWTCYCGAEGIGSESNGLAFSEIGLGGGLHGYVFKPKDQPKHVPGPESQPKYNDLPF